MKEEKRNIVRELRQPFPAGVIRWRVGAYSEKKRKAQLLAYLDARAVMDRLDNVFGISGWTDEYRPGPAGGVVCRITVTFKGRTFWKEDVAENTDFEGVKGGVSDAFKRAAVKLGVGRYLYNLDASWVKVEDRGQVRVVHRKETVGYCDPPRLPDWALPPTNS